MKPRIVNVAKGALVELHFGRGVNALVLEVERLPSGAVEVRNANTRTVIRQWSPKEARG